MPSQTYQLTVRIAPRWVAAFRKNQTKLCCAFGFRASESNVEYNVIAWAEDPTPVNTVTWSDDHFIAACKSGVVDAANATPNTTAVAIEAGNTFTLGDDWTTILSSGVEAHTLGSDSTPSNSSTISGGNKDPTLMPQHFTFNCRTPAGAMVFRRVRSSFVTPVYVLSMGPYPMPPGHYNISPTGYIVLFFASREEGTELDLNQVPSAKCVFRYAEQQRSAVVYTAQGTWATEQIRMDSDGDGRPDPQDWLRSVSDIA